VIVEMNSSVEAIEGSHVSLLCGADSNPPPLLTWMRDGTVLREAVAESLYLELEEVTPGEDGIYACLAENAYGQDNRTVELSVMCESRPCAPIQRYRGQRAAWDPPTTRGGQNGEVTGLHPPASVWCAALWPPTLWEAKTGRCRIGPSHLGKKTR
jgi:hypothetical protein